MVVYLTQCPRPPTEGPWAGRLRTLVAYVPAPPEAPPDQEQPPKERPAGRQAGEGESCRGLRRPGGLLQGGQADFQGRNVLPITCNVAAGLVVPMPTMPYLWKGKTPAG
jgi:hypothetical protein